ncbi:MAG: helix-turn-helix domain-containing protein [Clostridia bacterium]|nr:helix-turn-helix domain-containing protein [Clostridia bacterium]
MLTPNILRKSQLNEDGIDVRWQTFTAPHTTLLHSHEFYELELTLSGETTEYINGSPYEKVRGAISLLSPADFHTYNVADGEMKVVNIMFGENCMPGGLINSIFDKNLRRSIILSEDKTNTFSHLFSAMDDFKHYDEYLKNTLIKRLIETILLIIIKEYNSNGLTVNLNQKSEMERALHYIDLHFRDNPSVPDVAAYISLSPDYFSKSFKKYTGLFYTDYLNKCKIESAGFLLKSSTMSVTEICFNSGFTSLSNFLRVFKEQTGKTPKEYRTVHKFK